MEVTDTGKLIATAGGVLLAVGLLVMLAGRVPFLGRLPGDIVFQRDGVTVFVPLATMLLISVLVTVVLNVGARLFR